MNEFLQTVIGWFGNDPATIATRAGVTLVSLVVVLTVILLLPQRIRRALFWSIGIIVLAGAVIGGGLHLGRSGALNNLTVPEITLPNLLLTDLWVFLSRHSWVLEWVGIGAITVSTLYVLWKLRGAIQVLRRKHREKKGGKLAHGEKVGIHLSPKQTNFILRPIFGISAGFAIGMIVYLFAVLFDGTDILPYWGALVLSVLLSLLFSQNDATAIEVPKVHVGIFAFFGERIDIYLTEGTHYWYGGRIGFGVSLDTLSNPNSSGEREGFPYTGQRQIEIFARKERGDESMLLKNQASDFTEVNAKLTIAVKTVWPRTWADSDDPILDIAERARSGLRTIVSFFTGVDNVVMKSAFSKLMGGHVLITAFTTEAVGIHPKGSVIQNSSGAPIFEILSKEQAEDALLLTFAKIKLWRKIDSEGDSEMKKTLQRSKGFANQVLALETEETLLKAEIKTALDDIRTRIPRGVIKNAIEIQEREVVDHIQSVMASTGAYFIRASVSNITLSTEVSTQANIAAGENFQRIAQVRSAKTIEEVRRIIAAGSNEPGGEFATLAALAKDGHAKIIFAPGSDKITRAAIVGANQINGGG